MRPRIVSVAISPDPVHISDPLPTVTATFSDGSVKKLFSYLPDSTSYASDELVGMTEDEARALKAKKDAEYLTDGYVPLRFRAAPKDIS